MKHDMQTPSVIGAVLPLLGALLLASAAAAPADDDKTNAPAAVIEWKHPDWKEPDKVMASVNWDGLGLAEVVQVLRNEFKNEFDVVLPSGIPREPVVDPTTGLPSSVEAIETGMVSVRLRLQNVTASEIFNAMNLLFQAEQSPPARWELLMNGRRPTAVLRPLPSPKTEVPSRPQEQAKRSVFYVGNIVGDDAGAMGWDQFSQTIQEVCLRAYESTPTPKFQIHRNAALLIVTGNQEQIDFVRNLLEALEKGKPKAAIKVLHPAEQQRKPPDAKAP